MEKEINKRLNRINNAIKDYNFDLRIGLRQTHKQILVKILGFKNELEDIKELVDKQIDNGINVSENIDISENLSITIKNRYREIEKLKILIS